MDWSSSQVMDDSRAKEKSFFPSWRARSGALHHSDDMEKVLENKERYHKTKRLQSHKNNDGDRLHSPRSTHCLAAVHPRRCQSYYSQTQAERGKYLSLI